MKILIIKPSSFGDIIHSNPALNALREIYPDAKIYWLVFSVWSDIIDLFPEVDEKIVWNNKKGLKGFFNIIKIIRKQKFDLLIDLQGLLRTGIISLFSGAAKKLGVPGMKELSWLFANEISPEKRSLNAVFRSLEVMRFISSKDFKPRFSILLSDDVQKNVLDIFLNSGINNGDKVIGLVPFARGKAKQWPIQYVEKLIKLLNSSYPDYKVIILADKKLLFDIPNRNVIDLTTKTDLKVLAAVLKRCNVVVGPDTGSVHLASSLGVPVVMIFGGSNVNNTGPIADNATIIKHDFECSPCCRSPICKDDDCLKDIKPEEVLEAIEKWIK